MQLAFANSLQSTRQQMLTPGTDGKSGAENTTVSPVHRYFAHPSPAGGRALYDGSSCSPPGTNFISPQNQPGERNQEYRVYPQTACHASLSWTLKHRVPTEIGTKTNHDRTMLHTIRSKSVASVAFHLGVRCRTREYAVRSMTGCLEFGTGTSSCIKVSGSIRMCYQLMRHTDVKTTGICWCLTLPKTGVTRNGLNAPSGNVIDDVGMEVVDLFKRTAVLHLSCLSVSPCTKLNNLATVVDYLKEHRNDT